VIHTSLIHVHDFEAEGGHDTYEVPAQISERGAWNAIGAGRRTT
jgi:hypothetical protein